MVWKPIPEPKITYVYIYAILTGPNEFSEVYLPQDHDYIAFNRLATPGVDTIWRIFVSVPTNTFYDIERLWFSTAFEHQIPNLLP